MGGKITVSIHVDATMEKAWEMWTAPNHIMKWNAASPDWHTTKAENDLRVGGRFSFRMEAKEASFGFDFEGDYDQIKIHELIEYTMVDGRKCIIQFVQQENAILVNQTFEAENENPIEAQQFGWQSILNNFKMYVEQH